MYALNGKNGEIFRLEIGNKEGVWRIFLFLLKSVFFLTKDRRSDTI